MGSGVPSSDRSLARMSPATSAFPITPNDGADLAQVTNGIAFKTVGALHIIDGDGVERTIPSGVLAVGVIHPLRVSKVFSTGSGSSMDLWGFV